MSDRHLPGHRSARPVQHRVARGVPSYRPVRSPLVSMGPSLSEERRRRRTVARSTLAVLAVVAVVAALVALVVWLGSEVVDPGSMAHRTAAGRDAGTPLVQLGRPHPMTLATISAADEAETPAQPDTRLQLPINRAGITGIGYDHRPDPGVLELKPQGSRANLATGERLLRRFFSTHQPSRLRWFSLSDGPANVVEVGALPGTQVYAPITGTVIAISDYVINDQSEGKVVQLQPLGDGETIVVLRNIDADPALAVGQTVSEGTSLVGRVRDMGDALDPPLAHYTHDGGSGVELFARRVSGGQAVL